MLATNLNTSWTKNKARPSRTYNLQVNELPQATMKVYNRTTVKSFIVQDPRSRNLNILGQYSILYNNKSSC